MKPYAELSEDRKEPNRVQVRRIPHFLHDLEFRRRPAARRTRWLIVPIARTPSGRTGSRCSPGRSTRAIGVISVRTARPLVQTRRTVPWDQLAEAYRESNRNHATDITRKLAAVGCVAELMESSSGAQSLFAFLPAEVELLAEMEHERWSRERVGQGWTPGPGT